MSSTAARVAILGLALAGPSRAQEVHDERNPRAPDQALSIVFTPYYCSRCVADKLLADEPREIQICRRDAPVFAKDVGLKRDWIVIETPNFKVFSNLEGDKVSHNDSPFAAADLRRLKAIFPDFKPGAQGSYVDAHKRAHLYQIRLERIAAHYRALTGNEKPFLGMQDRYEVCLFEGADEYKAFSEEVLGHAYNPNQLIEREHLKEEPRCLVFGTPAKFFKGDRQLSNTVAHHAGHCLIKGHNSFTQNAWAWLDEGIAHFYERRESLEFNNFCVQGQDHPRDFIRGDWRQRIRHFVYRKKESSFGDWCEKPNPQDLLGDQHALAWSFVDWLAATDPVRLAKLIDLSKDSGRKSTCADAVQEVFGATPFALHERWRAYVLESYGP